MLEDVLVKVKYSLFFTDFYALDMAQGALKGTSLIHGRPFLRVNNTLISMKECVITTKVGDQI